jgi:hypothetical protein
MQQLDTSGILDNIVDRVIRAARLDVELYEEVEADEGLTSQAIAVVVIAVVASAIAGSIPALLWSGIGSFLLTLILSPVLALVAYLLWSYVAYFVGVQLFQADATPGEVIRTLGYAQAPRVLGVASILAIIPCLGPFLGAIIGIVGIIWSLLTSYIAIRQALDLDNVKTAIVIVIGVVILAILNAILGALGLAGAFAFSAAGR